MYITVDEVKGLSSLQEVKDFNDDRLQYIMDRADGWIMRATGREFPEAEVTDRIRNDLRTATLLLVELLVFNDNQENKEMNYSPVETERIGSYSYTLRDVETVDSIKEREWVGRNTGIRELDDILNSLRVEPIERVSFFSVYGPGRRPKQ
jgi:Protein of unknown function (DUF3199)